MVVNAQIRNVFILACLLFYLIKVLYAQTHHILLEAKLAGAIMLNLAECLEVISMIVVLLD